MKAILALAAGALLTTATLACDPSGWTLMRMVQINLSDYSCTYSKGGASVKIIVKGPCPSHPC